MSWCSGKRDSSGSAGFGDSVPFPLTDKKKAADLILLPRSRRFGGLYTRAHRRKPFGRLWWRDSRDLPAFPRSLSYWVLVYRLKLCRHTALWLITAPTRAGFAIPRWKPWLRRSTALLGPYSATSICSDSSATSSLSTGGATREGIRATSTGFHTSCALPCAPPPDTGSVWLGPLLIERELKDVLTPP